MRPMRIGCCVALEAELTAARALSTGATGTNALAPAARPKNARDVLIVTEVLRRIPVLGWQQRSPESQVQRVEKYKKYRGALSA